MCLGGCAFALRDGAGGTHPAIPNPSLALRQGASRVCDPRSSPQQLAHAGRLAATCVMAALRLPPALAALAAEVPAAGPALADAYYELVHERCAAAPVVRTTRPTAPHETLVAEHACNAGRMPSLSWPTWRPGAPRRTTLSRNTTLSAGALRLRRESSAPLLRSTAC